MKSKCNYEYTVYKVDFALWDILHKQTILPSLVIFLFRNNEKRKNCPVLNLLTNIGDEPSKNKIVTNISLYTLYIFIYN